MPVFGLFSSPAEYSTMGHVVLDLTSLTYQPTTDSSDRSGHPKETCNLCHVRAKTQHIRLMHQTCMKMKRRMTNLLCVRQQEKKRSKKDVLKPLMTKTLHLWFLRDLRDLHRPHSDRRKKDNQYGRIQLLYWNKRCKGTRASEQMRPRFWAKGRK